MVIPLFVAVFDDDDDEFYLQNGWPTEGVKPHLQPEQLPDILTIASL